MSRCLKGKVKKKGCRCGSRTHQRVSHKKCPWNRWRKLAKVQSGSDGDTGSSQKRPREPVASTSASQQGRRRLTIKISWKSIYLNCFNAVSRQNPQDTKMALTKTIKKDPKLKKENVIVAYGSATFTSTMRGKRSVPVKRFLQHLRRYVTVVMTSEMRTSRVCSNGCGHEAGEDPAGATGDEGQSSYDLIPVRSERSASGRAGRCIFAVRYCKGCRRMWNRDVNAAQNIARMFFHQWQNGGGRPTWSLPRLSPSS